MLIPYKSPDAYSEIDFQNNLKQSVIKTLSYSMVFNYPLTLSEIYRYLIGKSLVNLPLLRDSLDRLVETKALKLTLGYYYLPGFEGSVAQRERRKVVAGLKFPVLERFVSLARYIPTIKMIGLSGGLAMENAHKEDDIDLFVVTSAGTTWLTRLLCVFLAESLRIRRRPSDSGKQVENKICLNMFVDEAHMEIPKEERDLFCAHEVIQLKPLYDKECVYEKFLLENSWVSKYLPNAVSSLNIKVAPFASSSERPSMVRFAERVAYIIQRAYMKMHVTHEVLKDGYLRFHPSDARRFVLRRYEQILQRAIIL